MIPYLALDQLVRVIVVFRVRSDQFAVQFGLLDAHAARGRRRDLAALGQIEVRRRQLTNGRTQPQRQQHRGQRPAAHRAAHGHHCAVCERACPAHTHTSLIFLGECRKKTDLLNTNHTDFIKRITRRD